MSDEVECAVDALDFDYELLESPEQVTLIDYPKIPFLHFFKYPLGLKSDLLIGGTVLSNADKFAVDMCQRKESGKTVVFHFSVRLDLNYVARNTFIKGSWGYEEGHSMGKSPFIIGKEFLIEIFLLAENFLVSVNGNHFCGYSHRVPPLFIDSLEVYGDVKLSKIELSKKEVYPSVRPDSSKFAAQIRNSSDTAWLTPLLYKFEEQLNPEWKIVVDGRVKLLPHHVVINLQTGRQVYPRPSVGFHLSIRWNWRGEDTIVFNTWEGQWDREIVTPLNLLFRPGKHFKLEILLKTNHFEVIVDSERLPPYPIRLTNSVTFFNLFNTLNVEGDAEIFDVLVVKPNQY